MKSVLLVATGGAAGAVVRYLISLALKQSYGYSFPWPTFFINITGCLAIGIAYSLMLRSTWAETLQPLLIIGFLGGYTTFSAFGWETLSLLQARQYSIAALYVLASNVVGLAAVWGGFFLSNRSAQ